MRQKYVISMDEANKRLLIQEFADIEKSQKNAMAAEIQKRPFAFLCEETYENETILDSISRGTNHLVATIRTRNLFPTRPFAVKIAESIIGLYQSPDEDTVELFLDDIDLATT